MGSSNVGRPLKRPEDVKHNQLKSCMTDAEMEAIDKACELTGIPRSVYVRTRIIAAAKADIQRLTTPEDKISQARIDSATVRKRYGIF